MAKARIEFDWEKQFELAIDPQKARERKDTARGGDSTTVCSMCGDYCSMKLNRES